MNILRKAAEQSDIHEAIKLLHAALGLSNTELAIRVMPADYRWAKFSPEGRLAGIAEYLRAECFEAMELVEARMPMDTVGTND